MNTLFKLAGSGVTVGGTLLAKKLVTMGWEKKTGRKAPTAADDVEDSWQDALLWGAMTAVLTTIIQVTVGRAAQSAIKKAGQRSSSIKV